VVEEIGRLDGDDPEAFAEAVGRAALMGARGNSGVILAQVLRGLVDTLWHAESAGAAGSPLAAGLRAASDEARRAVARPVEGTVLSVLEDAAAAAEARDGDAATVAESAFGAAEASLDRTREVLPELRSAGVVDAGGRGILLLFDALASVLGGHAMTVDVGPGGPVGHQEADVEGPLEFRFEVMYLLHGDDALVPALSDRLAAIGDSVVVVGGGGLYKVHVHTNDPDLAVEAATEAGRTQDVRVADLEGQVAEQCAAGQARAVRVAERQAVAMVAVADGDGLAALFRSLGAVVVPRGPGNDPSVRELLDAIEAAPAPAVVVLPGHPDVVPAAERAARESAKEVRVVPTSSIPEGLSAAAAFNPLGTLDDAGRAMEHAAGGVAAGAVTRAARDASTPAGDVAPGDWLGLVDGEVVAVGDAPVAVVVELVTRLRRESDEILTVLWGADATEGEVERLRGALAGEFYGLEVEIHRGDQPGFPFLLGLE
jgi:DAK2 domain fusion protein YloV